MHDQDGQNAGDGEDGEATGTEGTDWFERQAATIRELTDLSRRLQHPDGPPTDERRTGR